MLRSQVYEITFEGRAGHVLRAEFDDCEVSLGQDTTTLRVELPGQPALWGIIERMMEFGLKLIALRLLTVPHVASWDGSAGQGSPAKLLTITLGRAMTTPDSWKLSPGR